MNLKKGFLLRTVAGQHMVVPVGEAGKRFHGVIQLNDTGKVVWQGLADGLTEQQIVEQVVDEYDVTLEQAQAGVEALIQQIKEAGFLED